MAIRMKREQVESIRLHAEKSWPDECCGILAGDRAGDTRVVREVWSGSNIEKKSRSGKRFRIEPSEVWRSISKACGLGMEIVGFYHSHPGRSAVPSRRDASHAWPGCSSIILEVRQGVSLPPKAWIVPPGRSGHVAERIIMDQEGGTRLP